MKFYITFLRASNKATLCLARLLAVYDVLRVFPLDTATPLCVGSAFTPSKLTLVRTRINYHHTSTLPALSEIFETAVYSGIDFLTNIYLFIY